MGMRDFMERLNSMSPEMRLYGLRTLPRHLLEANQLERLHFVLTNLEFIEAKSRAEMVNDLQADYISALNILPEAQEEMQREHVREQKVESYTRTMITFARAWSNVRAGHVEDPRNDGSPRDIDVPLPILASVQPWTDDQIQADIIRVVNNPTRFDIIRAFSNFMTSESHNLILFAKQPGYCLQQAHNYADSGPVVKAAEQIINSQAKENLLLQNTNQRAKYSLHSALVRTIDTATWIEGLDLTPDGKILVESHTGGWDGQDDLTPRVWNVLTGEILHRLKGHTAQVHCVRLTPDGKLAVSGSRDRTLRVWDLSTGQCLLLLEGHTDQVWSVSITPDGRTAVSAGDDNTIRVWDLKTGQCQYAFNGHTGSLQNRIQSLGITPDGKIAVSASQDTTLRVWDLETGKCLNILNGHKSWVNDVSITPNGQIAVSAGQDKTVLVWDLAAGKCLNILTGHTSPVHGVNITSDGKIAVSGSSDGTVRVWDVGTGHCLRTLKGHTDYVLRMSMTPDGTTAVSSGRDETLRVWNLTSGQLRFLPEEHYGPVNSVRLSPNGTTAVSAGQDGVLHVWDSETGDPFRTLKGHAGPVLSVSMMPYEPMVVSGGVDRTLRVWDVNRSQWLKSFDADTVSPNAVTPGFHGGFDVLRKSFVDHKAGVTAVNVMPDGRTIVTGSADGIVRVWDFDTGQYTYPMEGHLGITGRGNPGRGIQCISVMTDGRTAVSGGMDSTFRVWNLKTGKCLRTFTEPKEKGDALLRAVTVNVTPDGRTAVSASGKSIHVWDLTTGKRLLTLDGHTDWVAGISLAADGKICISASVDHTVRAWDLTNGQCLAIYRAPDRVRSMSEVRVERLFAIGLDHGSVVFVSLHGFSPGTPIVTAVRLWFSSLTGGASYWNENLTALCEHCGQGFEPAPDVSDAIRSISGHLTQEQSPCLDLPAEAWSDPRLLAECPHCHQRLKFNPFILDPIEQDTPIIGSLQRITLKQDNNVVSVSEIPGGLTSHLSEADKVRLDVVNQINIYKQELIIYRSSGDYTHEANTLEKLGNGYLILGEISLAIKFFEQYLHLSRQLGNSGEEGQAMDMLGDAYYQSREPNRAIDYYKQALTIAHENGFRHAESITQYKLGQIYMESGEFFLAIKSFGEMIGIAQKIGDRKLEGVGFRCVSLAFWFGNSRGMAIKHAQTALDIFEEIGAAEEALKARDLLSRLRNEGEKQEKKRGWRFWK